MVSPGEGVAQTRSWASVPPWSRQIDASRIDRAGPSRSKRCVMRELFFGLGAVTLASLGCGQPVVADQCEALVDAPAALLECLERERDAAEGTMTEALGGALAVAQGLDQKSGTEIAVLAVEASQQAWAAYRDTACEAQAAFMASAGEADAVELACAIELTRTRTDELSGLASLGGG
jgi:uncharacterized protein YecT (DUF1311 family)